MPSGLKLQTKPNTLMSFQWNSRVEEKKIRLDSIGETQLKTVQYVNTDPD